MYGIQVVDRERLPRKRRWPGRERLRRRQLLARHRRALRHRALLDRPDRLAGRAIEHVQIPGLAGLCDDVDAAAVVTHRRQLRRGVVVHVPDVVMHGLEVPEALAGARVERDQAVRVEVVAVPVAAVEIVLGAARGHVHDAARDVHRGLGPVVRTAHGRPCVGRPGVGTFVAGARHGAERPHHRAGAHVEGPDVARRRRVLAVGRRSEDQQVLEHTPWQTALLLDLRRVAVEPFTQIDHTILAEGGNGLARLRVEGTKHVQRAEQQALVAPVGTLPVVHAADRERLDLG